MMDVEKLQREAREREAKAIARLLSSEDISTIIESARASFFQQLETFTKPCTHSALLAAFNNAISELVMELSLERECTEALATKLLAISKQR